MITAQRTSSQTAVTIGGSRGHFHRNTQHHGVTEPWSADRDFSRFPELKTVNPLLA